MFRTFLLVTAAAAASACTQDPLTCLQMDMFRGAKSLLDKDVIDLWGGLRVVRDTAAPRAGRALENKVLTAADADSREEALEEFAVEGVREFVESRSLRLDLAPMARDASDAFRSLAAALPQGIQQQVSSFFSDEEGRGKKKKLLRALLPLFLGLKMKLAGFLVLSYFIIALIAKKALLASLVSLAIAGFLAIKKMMSQQHHAPHHEISGWSASPSFGYSAGAGSGWEAYGGGHDIHGAYSNNVAHSLAYAAQKPATR